MKELDNATPLLFEACMAKRVIRKGWLKFFSVPQDDPYGYGLGGSTGDDDKNKGPPTPVFLLEMDGVLVSNVQQSGSSGGSGSPVESFSLTCVGAIAFHYRDSGPDAFPDTSGGISVFNDLLNDKINLVKLAADPRWSYQNHSRFPLEFRNAVKCMLMCHRRAGQNNVFATMPKEVLLVLIAFLSLNYEPVSPLKTLMYPPEHVEDPDDEDKSQ